MNSSITETLMNFIDCCPTAFHVTAEIKQMLADNGYTAVSERQPWDLKPGGSYVCVRNDASLIAFRIPKDQPAGFMIGVSHCDSPALKIKPDPETESEGLVRLNVEAYGGLIRSPWFDRPLSIAGRICFRTNRGIKTKLIHIDSNVCIIPSLAIHMDRSVNTEGHAFSVQKEMLPILREKDSPLTFMALLAKEAGVAEDAIISHDLFLIPHTKAVRTGADGSFISAPHLDDLQCTFPSAWGFLHSRPSKAISILGIFDHEEIGSTSYQGADGTFLEDTMKRIKECLHMSDNEFSACCANSFMISADNSHASHPNYKDKADLTNRPHLNGGIVIKHSAPMKYMSDAVTSALIEDFCQRLDIPVQHYANHADIPGGSTLGRFVSTHIAIPTVDLGLAQLAMHSPYETAGAKDADYLVRLYEAFYASCIEPQGDGTLRIA